LRQLIAPDNNADVAGLPSVRQFYATTSSSNKGKRDVIDMQKMMAAKEIHLRPDFEPWIPVDVMSREERELIFTRAGTRYGRRGRRVSSSTLRVSLVALVATCQLSSLTTCTLATLTPW